VARYGEPRCGSACMATAALVRRDFAAAGNRVCLEVASERMSGETRGGNVLAF
jgi:hypothetical protein